MKIKEIIESTQENVVTMQPSVVKQQARVSKVVRDIATSDAKQVPSEMDKVMAMRSYATMKKRADKQYAERLRQQLANAERTIR